MTNREKLIKTNIYDLLCRIQNSLSGNEEDLFGSRCSECIAKWLDEEAE